MTVKPLWRDGVHFGQERRETSSAGARRIIAETLRKERVSAEGLRLLSASHRIKVDLALRLRRETTVDLKWIAQELGVGSWKYLSDLLSKDPQAAPTGVHPTRLTAMKPMPMWRSGDPLLLP